VTFNLKPNTEIRNPSINFGEMKFADRHMTDKLLSTTSELRIHFKQFVQNPHDITTKNKETLNLSFSISNDTYSMLNLKSENA